MNNTFDLSRRDFLARTALAAAGMTLAGASATTGAETKFAPPIAVFSKIYQELKLDFAQAADLTAESGLDGVDCPVRPGGEILPDRAMEDLPRYAEALRQRKVGLLLLTTAILSPATPHAEEILRTAKKLGLRFYRLGSVNVAREADARKQIGEIKAQLKDLAALNKEVGITGVFQNHSPTGRNKVIGGDLNDLHEIVKDFDPEQIGVAFDLGHALIVHGDDWSPLFEKLKRHVKVAYVKDTQRGARFVRFGKGEFGRLDWFTRLKAMNCVAPMSLHVEFDWTGPDKAKTRAALLQALKESVDTLRGWLAKA